MSNVDPLHTSEIPPKGALIKVVAHDVIAKKKSGPAPVTSPRRRASTLGVISELPGGPEFESGSNRARSNRGHQCLTPTSSSGNFSPSGDESDRRIASGTIKAFGGEISDKSTFRIEDRVVQHPGDDASSVVFARDVEYRIVSDVSYLLPIPESMPMKLAAILAGRGLFIYEAVKSSLVHCRNVLSSSDDNSRKNFVVVVVCNDEFAMVAVQLLKCLVEKADLSSKISIALAFIGDDGVTWYRKNMPELKLIQWNRDAYDQVLIERTSDACGGPVDVVIGCVKLGSPLQRALRCLKPNGVAFVTEEVNNSVWKTLEKLAEQQEKQIIMAARGNPSDLRDLIELVSNDTIQPAFLQENDNFSPGLSNASHGMRRKAHSLSSKTTIASVKE